MQNAIEIQTPKERAQAVIDRLGLTISATFIPFSKSKNAKPRKDGKVWRSLNWSVTLNKRELRQRDDEGRDYVPRAILTTDYSAGEGHCPAYKASVKSLGSRDCSQRREAIDYEIEHGHAYRSVFGPGKALKPDSVDVIYSLVRDSDVIDYGSFEEWAENYSYDTDSREAERIYRACLDIALKLRNGIGEAAMAELREAFQDY